MKKMICSVLSLVMLLSMVVLPSSAAEVKKPTEEEMKEIFSDIGFACTMVGNFWATDGLGSEPEKVPDETAFWYLCMSGALNKYYVEDEYGGWYKLNYNEYIALIDAAFTNHSDMKQYLAEREYYDASTGAVKDSVMDIETLAVNFINEVKYRYGHLLEERYKFTLDKEAEAYDILCEIGRKRGMVIRGGETDTERAANMLLEEYRNCKIGFISLERVEKDA